MSKYKVGDAVRIIGVEVHSYMKHMLGTEGVIESKSGNTKRPYMVKDKKGEVWYFSEKELEPAVKDQLYYKKENDKIKVELSQIAERILVLQKSLQENEKQIKELTSPVL